MNLPSKETLTATYGESEKSMLRFQKLAESFEKYFHNDKAEFFSAPGRTEIIGNHTDHNGGLIAAVSINLDTISAAYPNDTTLINIVSEGYEPICLDINTLEIAGCSANSCSKINKDTFGYYGTAALIAGITEACIKFGFNISGFNAVISTNVISAAGVSSSASFEMLICAIINHFFNGNMEISDYAHIGQYAENVYWNKASGLMDQIACAVGGTILLDFSDKEHISYRKLSFSFEDYGYSPIIVNTGKGHSDLSKEYSDIPKEMKQTAAVLEADLLCETNIDKLLDNINFIDNDRAILRSLHFFEENRRVKDFVTAIEASDIDEALKLISQSGNSSWKWLQNCYTKDHTEQKISLTLALTELFLNQIGKGACRIHGGGFAGVILCIIPIAEKENYINYILKYVGRENVYPLDIREHGVIHLEN